MKDVAVWLVLLHKINICGCILVMSVCSCLFHSTDQREVPEFHVWARLLQSWRLPGAWLISTCFRARVDRSNNTASTRSSIQATLCACIFIILKKL